MSFFLKEKKNNHDENAEDYSQNIVFMCHVVQLEWDSEGADLMVGSLLDVIQTPAKLFE